MNIENRKYYSLLKEKFNTKEKVATEIINLEAILQLPKGTEHFISDIHGEFLSFDYVLRNGSGSIKEKLKKCFKNQTIDMDSLSVLIYYPSQVLTEIKKNKKSFELHGWYQEQISLLITVTRYSSKKYTRSKVRKALPKRFAYVIEELLEESSENEDKKNYIHSIIDKLITLNQADEIIEDLAYTIQRLVVDHLHILGDIYDRGPRPDLIMDRLINYHSVDIQWGNHDMIWLGAIAGSEVSLMSVIRICARYGNLDVIEDIYGIPLRPFIEYSKLHYIPLKNFEPKLVDDSINISELEKKTLNIIQQAAAILQFKLEGQLINRRPEFGLEHRKMLESINYKNQTITIQEQIYNLVNFCAPTVDPNNPTKLTDQEHKLIKQLIISFQKSEKLKKHMDFLIKKGRMYLCYNNNLLIHGCIPLHENGDFKSLRIENNQYQGIDLLNYFEKQVRMAYNNSEAYPDLSTDMFWYLWCGECSSLFGKQSMTTFERYYIEDSQTHVEQKNSYYKLRNNQKICQEILKSFNLPVTGHIINGHTPIREKDGENPIKANGQLIVIDGGFAKSYQKKTGIAGYTLLSNSYGLQLAKHHPFSSIEDILFSRKNLVSNRYLVYYADKRITVRDTNIGKKLTQNMLDLEILYKEFDNEF